MLPESNAYVFPITVILKFSLISIYTRSQKSYTSKAVYIQKASYHLHKFTLPSYGRCAPANHIYKELDGQTEYFQCIGDRLIQLRTKDTSKSSCWISMCIRIRSYVTFAQIIRHLNAPSADLQIIAEQASDIGTK